MMQSDIHGSKTSHREAANATIRSLSQSTILCINKPDQIIGYIRLDVLAMIEAIAPFARLPRSSISIRQNQDEFRYLTKSNQCISRLIGFAAPKPVAISTRRSVQ